MELFTATGKPEKFFFTTRGVRCVHRGLHGTHRYDFQVLATSYRCVPCNPRSTHRTTLVVKKNFFGFHVAVNNSIKVGPFVFLL